MPELTCRICSKLYTVIHSKAASSKYCSAKCRQEAGRRHRFCQQCGQEIMLNGKKKNRLYCSRQCMGEALRKVIGKECLTCHKPMVGKWRSPVSPNRKFCSVSCYHSYKGRTGIEIMAGKALSNIGEKFSRQRQFGRYTVDFYLPMDCLAVEVDGDYWHGKGWKSQERIKEREDFFKSIGIAVVRITESEVNVGLFMDKYLERYREANPIPIYFNEKAREYFKPSEVGKALELASEGFV